MIYSYEDWRKCIDWWEHSKPWHAWRILDTDCQYLRSVSAARDQRAQDGTNPVEMLGYVLQPYTPLNLKEKELLNAIEGPPTLQSSVIPAWNYVPNC